MTGTNLDALTDYYSSKWIHSAEFVSPLFGSPDILFWSNSVRFSWQEQVETWHSTEYVAHRKTQRQDETLQWPCSDGWNPWSDKLIPDDRLPLWQQPFSSQAGEQAVVKVWEWKIGPGGEAWFTSASQDGGTVAHVLWTAFLPHQSPSPCLPAAVLVLLPVSICLPVDSRNGLKWHTTQKNISVCSPPSVWSAEWWNPKCHFQLVIFFTDISHWGEMLADV